MPINNLARTAFSLPTGSSVHSVSLNISVHKQTSMHMCTCIVKPNGRMYRSRCVKFILALSAFISGNTATATKWTLTCERINCSRETVFDLVYIGSLILRAEKEGFNR